MDKQKLRKELKDQISIEKCASTFGIVGDGNRLKICYLLCHYPELSVSDISDIIGLSLSATSRSLERLEQSGVVKNRKEARRVFYSLTKSQFSKVVQQTLKTL